MGSFKQSIFTRMLVTSFLLASCSMASAQETSVTAILDVNKVLESMEEKSSKIKPIKKKIKVLRKADGGEETAEKIKALNQQQADILSERYHRITKVVDRIARAYNINLVHNFNSKKPKSKSLQEVKSRISKNVIFHRQLDLTNLVIEKIKENNSTVSPKEVGVSEAKTRLITKETLTDALHRTRGSTDFSAVKTVDD